MWPAGARRRRRPRSVLTIRRIDIYTISICRWMDRGRDTDTDRGCGLQEPGVGVVPFRAQARGALVDLQLHLGERENEEGQREGNDMGRGAGGGAGRETGTEESRVRGEIDR